MNCLSIISKGAIRVATSTGSNTLRLFPHNFYWRRRIIRLFFHIFSFLSYRVSPFLVLFQPLSHNQTFLTPSAVHSYHGCFAHVSSSSVFNRYFAFHIFIPSLKCCLAYFHVTIITFAFPFHILSSHFRVPLLVVFVVMLTTSYFPGNVSRSDSKNMIKVYVIWCQNEASYRS